MNMEQLVDKYLENKPLLSGNKMNEFEIRFGTNPRVGKPINRIDYENVIKYIMSCGFETQNKDGNNMLRITNEFVDKRTGTTRMSNIRTELVGDDVIKEYCIHNSLQKIIDMPSSTSDKIKFTQKMYANDKNGERLNPIDVEQYNLRVAYQTENDFNIYSNISKNIIRGWTESKKVFRLINRVRFYHSQYPIYVDVSIVKSSSKKNRQYVPEYTIQDSNVFNNIENYEIELEVNNNSVGTGSQYDTTNKLTSSIKKVIRIIMSGMQNTKFPITYTEQKDIINEYLSMIHGNEIPRYVNPKHFIGPSSYTLQIENVVAENESNVPNINNGYCVTDKADGERRFIYISKVGKIYMINTNMQIIFTGTVTTQDEYFETLIDGEYIKYDKNNKYINLYACFDIYYLKGKDIRNIPFVLTDDGNTNFRLYHLQNIISTLKYKPVVSTLDTKLRINVKTFYISTPTRNIFTCCSQIFSNIDDDVYEYTTDGIIFTPNKISVGVNEEGDKISNFKVSWTHSFKWKPPEYNTIDFLVSVKKDDGNQPIINHIYQDGSNLHTTSQMNKYKTLTLRCGYDQTKHGYINPCEDIYQDTINNTIKNKDDESNYKPVPFVPTDPYDTDAHVCNVLLTNDVMMTEEGEPFDENMIVEFQYVIDNKKGWNWVPLRVRYDKTNELQNGIRNYGNAYHVANNNWRSIHYPIDTQMLRTGTNFPTYYEHSDVYYNRKTGHSYTRSLRDFHNLYVKSNLIGSVLNQGNTLIDYSVGKAGDMSKWMRNKPSFVFGIDISRDNIHNKIDGACARYINKYKESSNIFDALFVVGDSTLNIKNGSAFTNEKDRNVSNAVFGISPKEKVLIGKGVNKSYGKGSTGFDVGSCQFALHYMFENRNTLHNFMNNLSQTISIDGHFVATCYDGNQVFKLLANKEKGQGVILEENNTKIFEISKQYDETGFPDDENSLGYSINVYQETINKYFVEYLVNYNYLVRVMEDYGFIPLSDEEASHLNMPYSSGLFSTLYSQLEKDKNTKYYGKALEMSPNEKKISFLNRYMIFKKVRNVDGSQIMKLAMKNYEFDEPVVKPIEEDKDTKTKKSGKKRII
jgi:hypothetical protein